MDSSTPVAASRDREAIGAVLGRAPSGLFVLSAGDGAGLETGMLASWVQQASFDPPMVSIAVNRDRYLIDWLGGHPRLALSIVAASQKDVLKHFGKGFPPGEPAFEGLSIVRGATGLPMLADSIGGLDGEIAGRIDAGDHVLFLVRIESAVAGTLLDSAQPTVHVRRNGFRY